MRTTTLGQLTVSAQGLGCMGMSEWYGATDWDESIATIHRALDLGVTFIDTADIYGAGHNEVLVGRGIAGRRDEVQLATKFGIDRSGGDAHRVIRGEHDYVKRACESSLTRLGVDHIDLYYLHRYYPPSASIEEAVGAMADLVRDGKVRALGLTTMQRAASAPEIPPLAEVGLPGFDWAAWQTVAVPGGTPKDVVAKLNAEVNAAIAEPEVAKKLADLQFIPIGKGSRVLMNTPEREMLVTYSWMN